MLVRVGFSRGTGWIAKLICFFTSTDVSHSFFLVQSEAGEWVYEATTLGFKRIPWSEYVKKNHIRGLVDMEWPHVEVKRALDKMLGTPYPILAFLFLGFLIVLRRALFRPKRLVSDSVDCVMSVVRVAKEYAKIDLGTVITPAELQEKLKKR